MLLAEARGRRGELPQVLEKDTVDAHAAVAANTVRIEALEAAIAEIGREIDTIRDEHIGYFAAKAHAASLEAVEAAEAARAAIEACWRAWKAADGGWGRVRSSRRNLRWPDLPPNAITDLGSMKGAFDTVTRVPPWPGGRRPDTEQQVIDAASAPVEFPARWSA
jgi:hypothetical protein